MQVFLKESGILAIAGIIAEFNPLHNGHKYLIDCAKSNCDKVITVVSGNFVQRGDVAVIPKYIRAEMALSIGVDLVVELPTPWAMSTAQNFAFGAMSQLSAFNIDSLHFGSECGDVEKLIKIADIIYCEEFNDTLKSKINGGETYAKIRQNHLKTFIGHDSKILENPNDTLAIEYINASKKLGLNIKFNAVKRVGAGHNDTSIYDNFVSSTKLREMIKDKSEIDLSSFVPESCYKILSNTPKADINSLDKAIITRLKQLCLEDISNLADISEGMDNLIYNKIRDSYSYADLCNSIKTKRYTMARIRRILLSAFLGIDGRYFLKEPPYVKVLGLNTSCSKIIPSASNKPIITRTMQINSQNNEVKRLFELENRVNEIYSLALDNPHLYLNEMQQKLIKR